MTATGAERDERRWDEHDLLAQLQSGDEARFRQLVTDLTPVLTRLARTYTPTEVAAQDAVQDTWLVVIDKLDTFQGRSSLKTWVCGILVNKARRGGVREARSIPFSSAWRDDHGPAVDPDRFSRSASGRTGEWCAPPVRWHEMPEDRLTAKELHRVVDTAIAALPQRQREVITARDVVGMDGAEAAAVLGVSAGNQRVLLHRARSKVRAAIEEYSRDVDGQRSSPTADQYDRGREEPPPVQPTGPRSTTRGAPGP